MTRLVFIAMIVAAAILAYFVFSRGRALFKIVLKKGQALMTGKIPGRSTAEVIDFVNSLNLPDGATIVGIREKDRFRLKFNRHVSERIHQRIRNFLYLRP